MPTRDKIVSIDFCPGSAFRYLDYDAIVCFDIIRATTTLVTAVAGGRRAFAAANRVEAIRIARKLSAPLLAGADENLPTGSYEIPNSPVAIRKRTDTWRPLVLVSSYGTQLLADARGCRAVFVTSLCNLTATAEVLAAGYHRVALLGACSAGQLRCEDQIATARLGALLQAKGGFRPAYGATEQVIQNWSTVDVGLVRLGRSAEYLRETGQGDDIDFVVSNVDQVDFACQATGAEIHRFGDVVAHDSSLLEARSEDPARSVATGLEGSKTHRTTSRAKPSGVRVLGGRP